MVCNNQCADCEYLEKCSEERFKASINKSNTRKGVVLNTGSSIDSFSEYLSKMEAYRPESYEAIIDKTLIRAKLRDKKDRYLFIT